MNCSSCGCQPCQCAAPTVLNQARLISPIVSGGTFTGGTFAGPTINGGTQTGSNIVGATIDCTTLGCTQPPGTSDATLATTAFVGQAVADAISGANPDFCAAVQTCLGGSPTLCSEILNCINNTPGALANPIIFDPAVFATSLQEGASCSVALDPCTLQAFLDAGGPNALWTSFENAVNTVLATAPGFCAAVLACGVALLDSPAFVNLPTAPTPPLVDNSTRLATTAFVQGVVAASITGAITSSNPAFCSAVTGCLAGTGVVARGMARVDSATGFFAAGTNFISGATYGALGAVSITVTFLSPQPDAEYVVVVGGDPGAVIVAGDSIGGYQFGSKTINGFTLLAGVASIDYDLDWSVLR
jgi:hypothetical protein